MITMTVFTTGRLAAYERMMQDYGYRTRGKGGNNKNTHSVGVKKVVSKSGLKAGDSHAGNKG